MQIGDPKAQDLEARVRCGDRSALADLLEEHTAALGRWIAVRIDPRLRGRVSEADLIQEVYLSAEQRLEHFARLPDLPFGVWIRLLAGQCLIESARRHLLADGRAVDREVRIDAGSGSAVLAERLAGSFTSPSQGAMHRELAELLTKALDALAPADREVLLLRHFEGLDNGAVAARLGLSKSAATKRYIRALARLREILEQVPGLLSRSPG
ncbi:MAG: sigma-70 family RNA polymerase sigma factor [Isosphaeraceae bacterium]